jgi:hypothetical protein
VKKVVVIIILSLVVVLILIQLIPVRQRNPRVTLDIPTSPEVKAVLRQSCYDCHSNETIWPWYSSVAPASWLVASDVQEGREKLNFSTWDQYSTKERVKKLQETWEEVEEGKMPTWYYTAVHGDSKLTPENREALRVWSREALSRERDQAQQRPRDEKTRDSQ